MRPINEAERKRAFLNFLLLFVVTVAVILIAVFFSVQVPFKENDRLRKEKDLADNEKAALYLFEAKMQETMNLLDSINMSNNAYRYSNYVEENIRKMSAMISDSSDVKSICTKVTDNLKSLQTAYDQIKKSTNSSAELAEKEREIQQLKAEARDYTQRIDQLNALLYGKK